MAKDLKGASMAERQASAAEAKAALLAKLKPKASVTDPLFGQREAMKAAELAAVREQRAADKLAAQEAAAAARAADVEAIAAAEAEALALKRGDRKERKQLSKAEAQAKRDAKYAARKARK